MAKESPKQQRIVGRVMREFKEGQLESGGDGGKVKSRKQAIAIALNEAGASNRQAPAHDGKAGDGRAELYRQAQDAKIAGRSRMTKEQLRQALARRSEAATPAVRGS